MPSIKSSDLRAEKKRLEVERELVEKEWSKTIEPFKAALENAEAPFKTQYESLRKRIDQMDTKISDVERDEAAAPWKDRAPLNAEEFSEWLAHSTDRPDFEDFSSYRAVGMRVAQPPDLLTVKVFGATEGYEHGNRVYVAFEGSEVVGALEVQPSEHPGDASYVKTCIVRGRAFKAGSPYHINDGDGFVVENYSGVKQPLKTFFGLLRGEEMVCWKDKDHDGPKQRAKKDEWVESDEDYKTRLPHKYAPKSAVEAWLKQEVKGAGGRRGRDEAREICGRSQA